MKLAALVLFLASACFAAASEAAKDNTANTCPSCDASKTAKAEENAHASAAKPNTSARPHTTPRRIPYHMLMIR